VATIERSIGMSLDVPAVDKLHFFAGSFTVVERRLDDLVKDACGPPLEEVAGLSRVRNPGVGDSRDGSD
jgi:hypothetical protein